MKNSRKRKLKEVTAVWICLLLFVIAGSSGYAADRDSMSIMSIDASSNVSLNISSGTAKAQCSVRGDVGKVTKISITMYLQKYKSGGYSTVKTWSGSKSSYIYKLQGSKNVAKGTYRIKAKITCYKGKTSETSYKYSAVKKCS